MEVFSIVGVGRSTVVWGPTASVKVRVGAFGSLIDDSWILENVAIGAKEIVDVRQCFNDVSYIYALGNDQARCGITLQFAVFIGTAACRGKSNTGAIKAGLTKYVANRISQKTKAMNITIGSFSTKGWLVGIDIGQIEGTKGICHATAAFIMQLEDKSKKGKKLGEGDIRSFEGGPDIASDKRVGGGDIKSLK